MELTGDRGRLRIVQSGHVIERYAVGDDPSPPGPTGVLRRNGHPSPARLRDTTLHAVEGLGAGRGRLHGRGRRRGRSRFVDAINAGPWLLSTEAVTGHGPEQRPSPIHGGAPVRSQPFPARAPAWGEAEQRAVAEVMESGVLSQYIGALGRGLHGRPGAWGARLEAALGGALRGQGTRLSLNSATSALNAAAAAAAGVGPGDEVITSPYTMSASAVCALVHGAIPVLRRHPNRDHVFLPGPRVDPRAHITPRTKAIVAVGHLRPARPTFDAIMAIAREHDLVVIEDAAQAACRLAGRPLGRHASANIGVYQPQLPQDDPVRRGRRRRHRQTTDLAERLALAPATTAEAVVGDIGRAGTRTCSASNYRMGRARGRDRAGPARAPGPSSRAPRIANADRADRGPAGVWRA